MIQDRVSALTNLWASGAEVSERGKKGILHIIINAGSETSGGIVKGNHGRENSARECPLTTQPRDLSLQTRKVGDGQFPPILYK